MRHLQFVTTTKDSDGQREGSGWVLHCVLHPAPPLPPLATLFGRAQTGKTAIMLDYVWKLLKKIFNCSRRELHGRWATAAVYFRLPGRKVAQDCRNNELLLRQTMNLWPQPNRLPGSRTHLEANLLAEQAITDGG